jgi:hypothetical protein
VTCGRLNKYSFVNRKQKGFMNQAKVFIVYHKRISSLYV